MFAAYALLLLEAALFHFVDNEAPRFRSEDATLIFKVKAGLPVVPVCLNPNTLDMKVFAVYNHILRLMGASMPGVGASRYDPRLPLEDGLLKYTALLQPVLPVLHTPVAMVTAEPDIEVVPAIEP